MFFNFARSKLLLRAKVVEKKVETNMKMNIGEIEKSANIIKILMK